ncbi:GTPase IMAP family member 7-like [Centropristis striata]|uniref:GTPase IMAP family member 7-like n=1 Tax=Centropristis striata TaxID=184440 RepID=UPI0027E02290|nr:GTPase IMAP family member 7-like [Centropristis striata]
MNASTRIVILGKTGAGKSSLANTIFEEKMFKTNNTANSGTSTCQAVTKSVNGRTITLIDTPGFFDTKRSEEDMKAEIVRCITECAPGPHAFIIMLKVEKFTEHEKAVITTTSQYFSEEAFKYSIVVFSHGDELEDGTKIKEWVDQNADLSDLVKKCGSRCHVFDNKYWSKTPQDEYRNNKSQVKELLETIDAMTAANEESCFTNEMLQAWERRIQQEEERIKASGANMSQEEIRAQAKSRVFKRLLTLMAGVSAGALLGHFLGDKVMQNEGLATALGMCIGKTLAVTYVS